ncbi:hypothetical protein [Methyloglobulus sp.]|uniref:hypothetical protein n=1 Tax=Methyloglobulus sp. TaxID=2518622 RepID=UPI0032B6FFB1
MRRDESGHGPIEPYWKYSIVPMIYGHVVSVSVVDGLQLRRVPSALVDARMSQLRGIHRPNPHNLG